MIDIDAMLANASEANYNGTLRIRDTIMFGYYRLREGEHAGRVVIKTIAKIDNKNIYFFANGLTWIFADKIADVLCEWVMPTFSDVTHPIDTSKAYWYPDNSDELCVHKW